MAADFFPSFDDDALEEYVPDEDIDLDEEVQPPTPYGVTWRFDFDAGDIYISDSGENQLLSDIETVKEWIKHTLSIRRFESPVYGTDIGTDLQDLVGTKDSEFVLARIAQEIREAVSAHDRIVSCEVLRVFHIGDAAYAFVSFETDDSAREELVLSLG